MSKEQERAAMEIGQALQDVAEKLPEGWIVEVKVERGSGWAELYDPGGNRCCELSHTDLNLPESIQEFIKFAVAEG